MIVDARLLEGDEIVRTDVCVVGAGPAGIALAREWVGQGFQVALVESGSLDRPSTRWKQDVVTMSLARGESVGFPYDRLDDARLRAFGGSSHTWRIDIGDGGLGARLRPLDPIDFEKRDWVPYSGWPFDRSHLDPYYERAQEFFELGPAVYDAGDWEDPVAARTGLYRVHTVNGVPVMAKLTLAEDTIRRERLLNYCTAILPVNQDPLPDGVHSLLRLRWAVRNGRTPRRLGRHLRNVVSGWRDISRTVYRKLTRRRSPKRSSHPIFRLDNMAEQSPNPSSRVTLSDERDALGMRRVRLDWRLSSIDILSMARAQEIIDEELRRSRLGYLQMDLEGDTPPKHLKGGWHHMGTTRMHTDLRQGVVDDQYRVHGLANLYVAGSSVFPTAGYANPTLTIVALAIRLADHLKARLRAYAADFAQVGAGRAR